MHIYSNFVQEAIKDGHIVHDTKYKGYTIISSVYPSDYPSLAVNKKEEIELGGYSYDELVEELEEHLNS